MEIIDIISLTPDLTRRHQTFQRIVNQIADLNRAYLDDEGLTIDDCYTLELSSVNARILVKRDVPSAIYEQLHQCFKRSFS